MTQAPQVKVYVVEDESDIAELIRYNLSQDGYKVTCFTSGETALNALKVDLPDIILLDLMLPGKNGLQICQTLKAEKRTQNIPIVMVTARGSEQDILMGLEAGADDYVTKPFSPKVLTARVGLILKRASKKVVVDPNEPIEIHNIVIHVGRYEVTVGGEKVELRNSEFRILQFLAQRPGWVFTRSQIVDAIHGENYAVTDRSIDFQMVGLRKKLGSSGDVIETIRGVGYRFKEII